ncbi:hypothetical protein BVC80_9053g50 [Macleaya cordata]|uniref:Uncharacterized protein n=1 Tax=Macleaya cordata TaxID=56857 RepID=A0A200RA95_MACCD|nr:hypothetical protein BVC80_9053g50 [Macleaya cordata]
MAEAAAADQKVKVESCKDNQSGEACSESKGFCKVGKGWSCVITKTDGPDSGKVFFKCGEACTCETGSSPDTSTCIITETETDDERAFCKCGEGWTCVITKTEAPNVGKAYAECGDGCYIKVA